MSDPVSNADIEDVLSSIRRLVSEEPAGQAARRKEPPAEVERFVLTPALRIAVPEEAGQDGPEEPEAESADGDRAEAQPAEADGARWSDGKTEVDEADEAAGAAPDQPVADLEPQISVAFESAADWSEDTRDEFAGTAPESERAQDRTAPEPEEAEPPTSRNRSLKDRIAELEAALESAPQEWEPDGSEDGSSDESRPLSYDAGGDKDELAKVIVADAPGAEAEEYADADQPEKIALAEGEGDVDAAKTDDGADAADEPEKPSDYSAFFTELAALKDAKPESGDDIEDDPAADTDELSDEAADRPDADLDHDVQGAADKVGNPGGADPVDALRSWDASSLGDQATIDRHDDHEDTAEAEDPQVSSDEDDGYGNFLADDAATLDEESLREMVGDLVRQELQGVLGERITRNVRRLVRREIQRALAMRDLE